MTDARSRKPRGPRPLLPGTQKLEPSDIQAMIRVDHAGEFGALRIYQGQIDVLSRRGANSSSLEAVRRMSAQERTHFDAFERMMKDRAVRPTVLTPFWHAAGYALGAATALLGDKAAMACTVAVEDVIDAHYAAQIERLGEAEPELSSTIQKFHAEECAHRNEALERGATETPAYPLLSGVIRLSCRMAIALSERF